MTDLFVAAPPLASRVASAWGLISPSVARLALLVMILSAAATGFLMPAANGAAGAAADQDLVHLLRAMTGLKLLMAAAAAGVVLWRLGSPVKPNWLAGYVIAASAMFGGAGLVWNMAHLGLGALTLHAGLAATILLLWRDSVVGQRLETIIAQRRGALRRRSG